ncbi:expressed unknown protein [Ectocarpus siliculosus]|uniref:Ribosomal protein n=1 Tax=Ectocarpus siliculosus TaxID=2880 RepID=D8LSI6_ECTSI|nr:expressed unknown protein [Ectocarpus siliculosus]|eukprot:CBN77823.1 expressed unknown protein [Ectocarpus siliculosus]
MRVRSAVRRICRDCYVVKKKGVVYIRCDKVSTPTRACRRGNNKKKGGGTNAVADSERSPVAKTHPRVTPPPAALGDPLTPWRRTRPGFWLACHGYPRGHRYELLPLGRKPNK